jgi:hypothetical protein
MDKESIELVRLLLARLERISVDSYWAHRASGIRGSLLRLLEKVEDQRPVTCLEMKRLIQTGFEILDNAVREYVK